MATMNLSTAVRNGMLDAIETVIATAPIMRIRTGALPATCATADSGTVLATLTLPSDWMAAAASGAKTILGTWQDISADASGTAGHFRVYDSTGVTCHMQGDISDTVAATGVMQLVSTTLTTGQVFAVTTFTINAANG